METGYDLQTVLEAVERVWGYSTLRPMQGEAIEAGLVNRDSLVVLPTGGGKSLCYQVPALVSGRLDIVVSPLISLMKDQVDGLCANGYRAAAIYSGLTDDERQLIWKQANAGELRLLFVAPERLMNERFLDFIESLGVSSFAIDEAHCISHWGHDFRPEYRRLAELRKRFPEAGFHAFTATATEKVQRDIIEQLKLVEPCVLVGYFDRPNLVYRMLPRVDMHSQVLDVLNRHEKEAVIIYCISRKDTENLAEYLRKDGINAEAYHAGMGDEERRLVQDAFAHEHLDVVVATVAFGMGIDRSNVRCVIHTAMPKSVEHYQQETGRAGRDNLEAECVLLYSQADVIRWERLIKKSAQDAGAAGAIVWGNGGGGWSLDDNNVIFEAACVLLNEMQKLACGVVCRHKALVEYFGQVYTGKGNCGACDVCLNELDVIVDSTTIAKKIVSCVARVGQRFGVGYISDVLFGSKSEVILRNRHDELSVYGLMSEMTKKEIINLTHQLIDQNCLARTNGEYPLVILNEQSTKILRGEVEVQLIKPAANKAKRVKFDAASWEGVDRDLFEELRGLRRTIADEREVPAFIIFSDATLRDLARVRPGSVESMGRVYGIGAKKQADLGERFVQVISQYCGGAGIECDVKVGN